MVRAKVQDSSSLLDVTVVGGLKLQLLGVLLVGLPLLSKYTGGSDAKKVELQTVEYKLIKSSILASGTLAYREQVQLRSEVIGQVIDLFVEEERSFDNEVGVDVRLLAVHPITGVVGTRGSVHEATPDRLLSHGRRGVGRSCTGLAAFTLHVPVVTAYPCVPG